MSLLLLQAQQTHDHVDGSGPGRGVAVPSAGGGGAASAAGAVPKSRIVFWVSAASTTTISRIPLTGKKTAGPKRG